MKIKKPKEMNNLPSIKVFIITWAVLLAYLTTDFVIDASTMFMQLNYDWDNMETLETVNQVEVDSLSHDYLVLRKTSEFPKEINTSNTFSLEADGQAFFRCTSIRETATQLVFSGVKWINRIPERTIKIAQFEIVDLPLLQSGNSTVATVGDSQIIWRDARELRKNLLAKEKVVFVGNEFDVYGYPYIGGIYDSAAAILEKLPATAPAQKYILFFGAQDKATDKAFLKQDICGIFNFLQQRGQTETILAVTLPPSPNPGFDAYNREFNEMLKQCSHDYNKVKIIALYEFLKEKKDYLREDGVHLNTKGYLYLNKLLSQEIP